MLARAAEGADIVMLVRAAEGADIVMLARAGRGPALKMVSAPSAALVISPTLAQKAPSVDQIDAVATGKDVPGKPQGECDHERSSAMISCRADISWFWIK
jgi:hypothetical protein